MPTEVFSPDCGCEIPLAIGRFRQKHGECYRYDYSFGDKDDYREVIILSDTRLAKKQVRQLAKDFEDGKY